MNIEILIHVFSTMTLILAAIVSFKHKIVQIIEKILRKVIQIFHRIALIIIRNIIIAIKIIIVINHLHDSLFKKRVFSYFFF